MAEINKLTARGVKSAGIGKHGDGGGLWLVVRANGSKAWKVRYSFRGNRREMGIGALSSVPLSDARIEAQKIRRQVLNGEDPIEERRKARSRVIPTFQVCAEKYIEAQKAGWRNAKHAQQWTNTLKTYAFPVIGSRPVDQIETEDIYDILESIWIFKNETATRIRGRIESVLAWAAVKKYRSRENPAQWRNNLSKMLPKSSDVHKVKHHRALPFKKVGALMKDLRQREGNGARALEFAVLTAGRSGEVRGATWDEIDLRGKLWTIQGVRMKAGEKHEVPLSKQAVKLLKNLHPLEGSNLIFPAPKGGIMSDMTLGAVLKRMKVEVTAHGFRSTFRDWAGESTAHTREVCEQALAHTIGKVEGAYHRGKLLKKRVPLMQDWADYCDHVQVESAKVVPIRASK